MLRFVDTQVSNRYEIMQVYTLLGYAILLQGQAIPCKPVDETRVGYDRPG